MVLVVALDECEGCRGIGGCGEVYCWGGMSLGYCGCEAGIWTETACRGPEDDGRCSEELEMPRL